MIVYNVFADKVLDSIKVLFLEIKEELLNEDTLTLYKNGQKDEFIKEQFTPLLEDVSSKLKEQYAIATSLNDNNDDVWNSVYFFSDMYYELVTGVIKLISIRNEDIDGSIPLLETLATIRQQLDQNRNVEALSVVRDYIKNRPATYSDKPFFQSQINALLNSRQGIYLVIPPKTLQEYSNGTLLAYVDGLSIESASTTTLPPGTELDQVTGELKVSDTSQLVSGLYILGISTTIENSIESSETLFLQIGQEITATYTVAEAKNKSEYEDNFELATVATIDGAAITEAFLINSVLPLGMDINPQTGEIFVFNKENLSEGTYIFEVRTVDSLSRIIDHTITIIILSDKITSYVINPTKSIEDYSIGDVLAEPLDKDVVYTSIEVRGLPNGIGINTTTGDIFVEDESLIKPGTYEVSIKTIEDNGLENLTQITIVIGELADTEAIYTVNPPKATLSDYKNFDVLAFASDNNGNIVQASFIKGALPPGTSLNKFTGEIIVTESDNLISGKYTFTISTVDSRGGYSETTLTIPISTEVRYKISRARIVDDYSINELVAIAFDPIAPIVSAAVVSGTLPSGLELLDNGNIRVSDDSLLQAGTYTFTVETTNDNDDTSSHEITLSFLEDQEAEYIIKSPRIVDTYVDGEILAEAIDADGKIIEAKILKGNLPGGVELNADNGNIYVKNAQELSAGSFTNIQIETKDSRGGRTQHNITLEIFPDIEAVYVVLPPLAINQYVNGQNLALVTDGNAPIVSAKIITGSLPTGVAMDTSTGIISVINAAKLRAGTYPLTIETKDELGGISQNSIQLILNPVDQEAFYVIAPAKNIDSYINGFVLASPVDPDGQVVSAVIISGVLPSGTSLNSISGVIAVTDINALMPGTYIVGIITTDENSQTTTHSVQLTINPDNEADYTLLPQKKYDLYDDGEYIATVTDADGDIESAELLSGVLPSGITLITDAEMGADVASDLNLSDPIPVGYILVTNKTVLQSSNVVVSIKTVDITGGKTTSELNIVLPDDSAAVYTVLDARMKFSYRNGDILAFVEDADGPIVSAQITLGALPSGASLNSTNGSITVSDRTQLQGGDYTLSILTEDSLGGQTGNVITISIRDIPVIKDFVGSICERLHNLEERFKTILTTNDVINRTILDFTKVIEGKVCSDFKNPGGEIPWTQPQKESVIKNDTLSITNPIKAAILEKHQEIGNLPNGPEKDRAQQDLNYLTDLYNEVIINFIQLTGMRVSDVPVNSNHDIRVTYNTLKTQMQSLANVTELTHLRQNIAGFSYTGRTQLNMLIQALLS